MARKKPGGDPSTAPSEGNDNACPACDGTGLVDNGDSQLHPCGLCNEPQPRTRSEVLRLRSSVIGCCSAYADMSRCDCLERAISDEE